MKILIVSMVLTHPVIAGSQTAIMAQVETLKRLGNDVHFLYVRKRYMRTNNRSQEIKAVEMSRLYWRDKFHVFDVGDIQSFWITLKQKLRYKFNYYNTCDNLFPFGLKRHVISLNRIYNFDACIVQYYYLTKLFESLNISKKAVFTHDTFAYKSLEMGRKHVLSLTPNEEAKAMQRCTDIFAIQSDEFQYFKKISPLANHYVVYCPFEYQKQPITGNHKMTFLSGGMDFNVNGIKRFIRDIFPLIRNRWNDAELIIGGSICKALGGIYNEMDGITIYGYVDDQYDFYKLGDVAINPVYQGTGLKTKTFEAIAFDKVTLVHPHSVEGIFNKDNAPLLVSANPKEWVEYISKVWESRTFLEEIKERNEKYIKEMNAFIEAQYKQFMNNN